MAPFSKDVLLQDFASGLRVFSSELTRLMGHARVDAMLAPEDTADSKPFALAFIRELPAGGILEDAYDFAFNGRLRFGEFWEELQEIEGMASIFAGLRRFTANESSSAFELCERTIRTAAKRSLLDGSITFTSRGSLPNHIALADLALLAGVDDKTLRNLASSKQPHRLATVNIDGRTFVSLNVARPWLEARGFTPTVNEDQRPERNFDRDPFLSTLDLAEYIRAVRGHRSLSQEQLAKRMRTAGALDSIRRLEDRVGEIPESAALRLGKALGLSDPERFSKAVVELSEQWYDTPPTIQR